MADAPDAAPLPLNVDALRQLNEGAQRGDAGQVQAVLAVGPAGCVGPVGRALEAAVRNDHASTVAAFAVWDCQRMFCRLLKLAARHDSVHAAAVLVAAKANVNGRDSFADPPLYSAARKGHLSCVSLLLAAKACIHAALQNISALHHAAQCGHADVVECLVRAKADHRSDCHGQTPLYLAAIGAHEPVLRVLLGARADINPPTPRRSPLIGAARHARLPSVVHLLLGARADVNATLISGDTALFAAFGQEYPDAVVNLVLRAKADVNIATAEGQTPLHLAARDGRCSTARRLVRAKADVRVATISGCTAATLARENEHFELAAYLEAIAGL
jgi:ankyrin repeat protein